MVYVSTINNDDSIIFLKNGNRLLKIKITDYYYYAEEIDNKNKVVPDGQKYENVQAHWKDTPLIRVSNDNKYGFINKEGNIVVPIKFTSASRFENGNAMVIDEYGSFFINEIGEIIPSLSIDFKEI